MILRLIWASLALVLSGAPASAQAPAPNEAAVHLMRVSVVDEKTGLPVPDVTVGFPEGGSVISAWSAVDGTVTLRVPKESVVADYERKSLKVLATAPGYAKGTKSWSPEAGSIRDRLPESLVMKLQRGVAIGGRVLDENGRPVARAGVIVDDLEDAPVYRWEDVGTNLREFFGKAVVLTDSGGRWRYDRLPDLTKRKHEKPLLITVVRPDGARIAYSRPKEGLSVVRSAHWLDYDAMLAGKVHLRLPEGARFAGRVVDQAGRPLRGARLHVQPYLTGMVAQTVFVEDDGRFVLEHWDAETLMITAECPGYRGTSMLVAAAADDREAIFALWAAEPVRLRVVDASGQAVVGAEVRTERRMHDLQWAEWSARTDQYGRVQWDSAPDKPLALWIRSPTHGLRMIQLDRPSGEQVVTMRRDTGHVVSLRVTAVDAKTNAQIEEFKVNAQLPDAAMVLQPWGVLAQGVFTAELPRRVSRRAPVWSYSLSVEAPGYPRWVAERLAFDAGDQTIVARLGQQQEFGLRGPRAEAFDSSFANLVDNLELFLQDAQDADVFANVIAVPSPSVAAAERAGSPAVATLSAGWREPAMAASARRLLPKLRRTGIVGWSGPWDYRVITTVPKQAPRRAAAADEDRGSDFIPDLRVVVRRMSIGAVGELAGDYEISFGSCWLTPWGWRSAQGVRWRSLPDHVGDAGLRDGIRLSNLIADAPPGQPCRWSEADDAALTGFGEAVAALLRSRDVAAFVEAVGPEAPEARTSYAAAVGAWLASAEAPTVDVGRGNWTVEAVAAVGVTEPEFGDINSVQATELQVSVATANGGSRRATAVFGGARRRDGRWQLGTPEMRW